MDFLAGYGYAGMFLAAFLASTLLPVGSEIVLMSLLIVNYNPLSLITVATFGNVLGSLVNYAAGIMGGTWVMSRIFRLSDMQIASAERRFGKYGNCVLLFAWLPLIGDPLTVVAGILKTDLFTFTTLVTIGKFLRYLFVVLVFMKLL